jgi:hypothetical protein
LSLRAGFSPLFVCLRASRSGPSATLLGFVLAKNRTTTLKQIKKLIVRQELEDFARILLLPEKISTYMSLNSILLGKEADIT